MPNGFMPPTQADITKAQAMIESKRKKGQAVTGKEMTSAAQAGLKKLIRNTSGNGGTWGAAEGEQRRRRTMGR